LRIESAAHLDAMSVVNQSVENAIGNGRIAELFVPAGHRRYLAWVKSDSVDRHYHALGAAPSGSQVATPEGPKTQISRSLRR
jgi:hypothetical protein